MEMCKLNVQMLHTRSRSRWKMGKSFRSDVVITFASHRKVPGSKPGRNSVFEVFQQSGVFDMSELKYKHDA